MRVLALLTKAFIMMVVAMLMAGFMLTSPAIAVGRDSHPLRGRGNSPSVPSTTKHHSPYIMKSHFAEPQAAATNGQDLLIYNGGPVMKNSISYAIFWEPTTLPDGSETGGTATWHFSTNAGIEASPAVVQFN